MFAKLIRGAAMVLATAAPGLGQPVPFNTGEWEPFTSDKMPQQGCATELVAAICKAGGIDPDFHFFPWLRAEALVETGEAFGAFPYAMNEPRKAAFDFSDPLFYTAPKFIYRVDGTSFGSLRVASLADLRPYSVALLAGTWTEGDLRSAGIRVHLVNAVDSGVKMLQSGRVDFLVEDETVAFAAIERVCPGEADSFKSLRKTFWGATGNYLIVSRRYPGASALLARFNKGLKEIQRNGTYWRITAKYKMGTR